MKILLFTHIADIDGMGPAVLAKTVFKDVDVVYCNTFDLAKNLNDNLEEVKNYYKVFITDLSPNDEVVNIIENSADLKNKIAVFDHHPVQVSGDLNDYPYLNIKIQDENGLCSGTSLFYEYMKEQYTHPYIDYEDFAEFVELTRQYDTWEWKKSGNGKAEDLNILFFKYGKDAYVQNFVEKFEYIRPELFTEEEREYIKQYKLQRDKQRKEYIKDMHIECIDGNKVGVIDDMADEYKNDIPDVLRDGHSELDYLAMYIPKRGTISLRNIQPDFDVSQIARKLGGGGHRLASSIPATEENLNIFNILVDTQEKE